MTAFTSEATRHRCVYSKPTMAVGFGATMPGNTLVGIVCGWLFWQRGLIAAIVAHFSIDFVLHVLPAILAPIDGL